MINPYRTFFRSFFDTVAERRFRVSFRFRGEDVKKKKSLTFNRDFLLFNFVVVSCALKRERVNIVYLKC